MISRVRLFYKKYRDQVVYDTPWWLLTQPDLPPRIKSLLKNQTTDLAVLDKHSQQLSQRRYNTTCFLLTIREIYCARLHQILHTANFWMSPGAATQYFTVNTTEYSQLQADKNLCTRRIPWPNRYVICGSPDNIIMSIKEWPGVRYCRRNYSLYLGWHHCALNFVVAGVLFSSFFLFVQPAIIQSRRKYCSWAYDSRVPLDGPQEIKRPGEKF